MPELLNSLHCRNVKDLCFKNCCTRHGRAAPPPCPSLPHSEEKPLTDSPKLQIQTTLPKQGLITAIPSPSSPCVTQRKNIKSEILRNWWQTGPPTLQISFFYSAHKCKFLRDQIKRSQMHLSWIFVPHFHFIFFLKLSSAVQILSRIHLIPFPRAGSF